MFYQWREGGLLFLFQDVFGTSFFENFNVARRRTKNFIWISICQFLLKMEFYLLFWMMKRKYLRLAFPVIWVWISFWTKMFLHNSVSFMRMDWIFAWPIFGVLKIYRFEIDFVDCVNSCLSLIQTIKSSKNFQTQFDHFKVHSFRKKHAKTNIWGMFIMCCVKLN